MKLCDVWKWNGCKKIDLGNWVRFGLYRTLHEMFIWTRIQIPFRFAEVDCFAATTVNFINSVVFIFCSYFIFRFTKYWTQSVFSVENGSYFVRSEYTLKFSIITFIIRSFILILISSSGISVVSIFYCDWDKLGFFSSSVKDFTNNAFLTFIFL